MQNLLDEKIINFRSYKLVSFIYNETFNLCLTQIKSAQYLRARFYFLFLIIRG